MSTSSVAVNAVPLMVVLVVGGPAEGVSVAIVALAGAAIINVARPDKSNALKHRIVFLRFVRGTSRRGDGRGSRRSGLLPIAPNRGSSQAKLWNRSQTANDRGLEMIYSGMRCLFVEIGA